MDKLGLRTVFPSPREEGQSLKKIIQVGRNCRVRKISDDSDPVVLPKRLGRHTGIRAWLANLELSYIVWKLDGFYSYINDVGNPYFSSNFPRGLAHYLDSTSVDSYLEEKTRFKSVKDVIEIQIRLMMGTDLNRISLLYLLSYAKSQNASSFYNFLHSKPAENQELTSMPPMCIKDGAQQISQQLVKQVIGSENILLNHPVSNISYLTNDSRISGERNVYISTKNGPTFRCHQAIMALPPNVLREIEFSPPLPASKKYLINAMSMGVTIKFILTYKEPFWLENGFSGNFISNGSPITWLTDATYQNGVPTLVGFLAGYYAVQMSKSSENDLKVAILDKLSLIFDEWALEPTGFLLKNWLDEKFIEGGTICFPSIGTMAEMASIRSGHGPIYFAGSETSVKFPGTMAGAVHSGQRAAIQVLDGLRPQSLTSLDYFLLKESECDQEKENNPDEKVLARSSYSVFRWTILFPGCALGLIWGAYKLRSTYSQLAVPTL